MRLLNFVPRWRCRGLLSATWALFDRPAGTAALIAEHHTGGGVTRNWFDRLALSVMFRTSIRHGLTRIGQSRPILSPLRCSGLRDRMACLPPETFGWGAIATLATWMMTLFITRTEHRDTQAIHAKIDELLRTHGEARSELTRLDEQDVEEIEAHPGPSIVRTQRVRNDAPSLLAAGTPNATGTETGRLQILCHELPDIAGAASKNGLGGIKRHTEHRGGLDMRRHDELHTAGHDIEERRTRLREPFAYRHVEVLGMLDAPRVEANRLGHTSKIGVFQIGVGVEQPFDLHLQFDEAKRTIIEYRDLDRDFLLTAVKRSPISIDKPPSPLNEITWRPGNAFLAPSA